MFLIGAYAKYNYPYVWVSGAGRALQLGQCSRTSKHTLSPSRPPLAGAAAAEPDVSLPGTPVQVFNTHRFPTRDTPALHASVRLWYAAACMSAALLTLWACVLYGKFGLNKPDCHMI